MRDTVDGINEAAWDRAMTGKRVPRTERKPRRTRNGCAWGCPGCKAGTYGGHVWTVRDERTGTK